LEVKELGHIVLYVRDLRKSSEFYKDILGWKRVAIIEDKAVMFSSGRTHHELLIIEAGHYATPIPKNPRIGMYHFGLKIGNTDEELRSAIKQLRESDVPIAGTADHHVTHSVYISDPDGNEIELYIDVQPEIWRDNPTAITEPTKALNI
tara:strand:+ start:3680 stop:4126 length:447 start_codon:yes stop_codon:yes gene_type:complete